MLCLHAAVCRSMLRYSSDSLSSLCLFLAPKCMFFIMISAQCVDRGIITNSHDPGVKFASKAYKICTNAM